MPYLRNSIAYTSVKWWYLHVFFFIFSKFWNFWLLVGVKGLKMAQNHKKLCLLCFISQESYIIWLSFMVHLSKMIISSGVLFHLFKILRKWSNMRKNYVCCTPCLRNHTSYDHHLWCASVKWYYLRHFFSFFQNFDFSGC